MSNDPLLGSKVATDEPGRLGRPAERVGRARPDRASQPGRLVPPGRPVGDKPLGSGRTIRPQGARCAALPARGGRARVGRRRSRALSRVAGLRSPHFSAVLGSECWSLDYALFTTSKRLSEGLQIPEGLLF